MNIEEMTNEEIDTLIAKHLLGAEIVKTGYFSNSLSKDGELFTDDFFPSTDTESAIMALDAMYKYRIEKYPKKKEYEVATWINEHAGARYGIGKTIAEAACKSILVWNWE